MEMHIGKRVSNAKNDLEEIDNIIEEYMPFILKVTSKFCKRIVSVGHDDEISIAMLGFHDAINTYSIVKGNFLKYAELIMNRRLIDFERKEKRHKGHRSIHEIDEEDGTELIDKIKSDKDEFKASSDRAATIEEIIEISNQLREFGFSLEDISKNSPKQKRTLEVCHNVVNYFVENPELITKMKKNKTLPLAEVCKNKEFERKTLERHRKYLIALILIYSNGYEIIRNHLKQVFIVFKGGVKA